MNEQIEYWLSLLKVITIIVRIPASVRHLTNLPPQIFIILGLVVNVGGSTSHHYIGGHNWYIGDAPFVGGIGGFASVFVTASFACMLSPTWSRDLPR